METDNNFVNSYLTKLQANYNANNLSGNNSQKTLNKNYSKDLYINTATMAVTATAGTLAGYSVFKNMKNKLRSALNKLNFQRVSSDLVSLKEKLQLSFPDMIALEKGGKAAVFPNCIMLVGEDPELNNRLIKWTGKEAKSPFIQIKNTESLLGKLEEAAKRFEKTGERTLIHVDGLDQQLNPMSSPFHVIESLKDIMTSCSKDYHSTIIFSTTDPFKLDQAALQPYRVEKTINVNIEKSEFDRFEFGIQKVQELSEKLKKLSKTKMMVIGAAIGLAVGSLIIGIKHLISTKKENKIKT